MPPDSRVGYWEKNKKDGTTAFGQGIAQDYGHADCSLDVEYTVMMCFGMQQMKPGDGMTIGSTIMTGYSREQFDQLDSLTRYTWMQHELWHVGQWADGGWDFGRDVLWETPGSCDNKYEEADPWIPLGSKYVNCPWAP